MTTKIVHCPCAHPIRVRADAISDSIQQRTCRNCKREWWLVVHGIEHHGIRLVDFYPQEVGAIRGWKPDYQRTTRRNGSSYRPQPTRGGDR